MKYDMYDIPLCQGCGQRKTLRPFKKGIVKCTLCGTTHKLTNDEKGVILLINSEMTKTSFVRID